MIRNWFTRDEQLKKTVDQLCVGAEQCFQAFRDGNLDKVAQCVNEYWNLKKCMLPGNEPDFVKRLRTALQDGPIPMLCCSSLAGAGGGGFLYGLLAEGVSREKFKSAFEAVEGSNDAEIIEAKLDYTGLTASESPIID